MGDDESEAVSKPIHYHSIGDVIANRLRWQDTHDWEEIPCPDDEHAHTIIVCTVCGWPPALDGHCRCDSEPLQRRH